MNYSLTYLIRHMILLKLHLKNYDIDYTRIVIKLHISWSAKSRLFWGYSVFIFSWLTLKLISEAPLAFSVNLFRRKELDKKNEWTGHFFKD